MNQDHAHTILLVDDEPNVLAGLTRTLRREPYQVLTASSGAGALEILRGRPIDLVVSDHDMPGMNGVEFLAKVRALWPDTARFVLTGKASLDVAVDAINRGEVLRFFIKPCGEHELTTSIREALRNKDLMATARRLYLKLKRQQAFINGLEDTYPGISKLHRDSNGAILVAEEEVPLDVIEFLKTVREDEEIGID